MLIEYTCTTEWLWSSKYEAEMYGELVQNYCCLEDCGLCGGGAARFNLVRRNRKGVGGVRLWLQLTLDYPFHQKMLGVLTQA